MKPKLQLKPKNKVKVKASVKLAYAGAVFSVTVAVAFLVYYNLGTSEKSIANENTRLLGFSQRAQVVISNKVYRGDTPLYNFPLLVSVKSDNLKHVSNGGQVIHPKGYDIRVTKKDGISILSSQIDSYDNETGEIKIWVAIDTLSSDKNNDLFLYYGNPTVKAELPPLIWSNGYEAVWHLNGKLNADNTRKIKTTTNGIQTSKGLYGTAMQFSPLKKDYASVAYLENLDLKSDFSISAWINLKEIDKKQVVISNQGDAPGGYSLFIDEGNKLSVSFINGSGKIIEIKNQPGGETLALDTWYHIAGVFSKENKELITYIDGIEDRRITVTDIPFPSASELQIGRSKFDKESYFNGSIDELRISSTVRDQQWFATSFYNESLVDQHFSLGKSEELSLTSAEVKTNKNELIAKDASDKALGEQNNRLQSDINSVASTQVPGVLSSNIDVIQARLNNIKRVAEENN